MSTCNARRGNRRLLPRGGRGASAAISDETTRGKSVRIGERERLFTPPPLLLFSRAVENADVCPGVARRGGWGG